jgi:hypothetical protein
MRVLEKTSTGGFSRGGGQKSRTHFRLRLDAVSLFPDNGLLGSFRTNVSRSSGVPARFLPNWLRFVQSASDWNGGTEDWNTEMVE